MKAKVALATVSGKAYYLLVNELKRKNMAFLSLVPNDSVPIDIRVVITTKKESSKITHQNVLEYDEEENPEEIVSEAIRLIRGKRTYERLVVGVDPGRNFGVAFLGDGNILETKNCTSVSETAKTIKDILGRTPANDTTVRVGNGAPSYAEELLRRLDDALPEDVDFESVREEGTSKSLGETSHTRGRRDVSSAIKIGQRQGQILSRERRRNSD